jgi:hypothetical protein
MGYNLIKDVAIWIVTICLYMGLHFVRLDG